jgi:hypothetical protein
MFIGDGVNEELEDEEELDKDELEGIKVDCVIFFIFHLFFLMK